MKTKFGDNVKQLSIRNFRQIITSKDTVNANEVENDDDVGFSLAFCTTLLCFAFFFKYFIQEAQLMLTTGSTRLAVSRGQQTWYHSTCYI